METLPHVTAVPALAEIMPLDPGTVDIMDPDEWARYDLVGTWLAGRSEETRRAYAADLRTFASWFGKPDPHEACRYLIAAQGGANKLAHRWRAAMLEAGLSPATINRRLAAVRSMVALANRLGLISWTLSVEPVKSQPYRNTAGPGVDAIRAMVAATPDHRDRAILRLLFDRGLRSIEVRRLDLQDFDSAAGTVQILGKGRREKEAVSLAPPTVDALRAWVAVRGEHPGPLFESRDRRTSGHRLCRDTIRVIVQAAGLRAGVRATPHGLRHSAITCALERTGGDVAAVQRFSRHANVQTVMIYYDAMTNAGGVISNLVASSV